MTKRKRIFFCFIMFLLVYLAIETISCLSYFFLTGKSFFSKVVISSNNDHSKELILPPWLANNHEEQLIHPYLGFINNPEDNHTTDFGFTDNKIPLQKRSKDKVIVGVFGGSAAEILAGLGREVLKKELKKIAVFSNKEIIMLNLAIGGYKQPQQLLTLNYLLALGGEFDIIINFDGFNEVVLPAIDNIPYNVSPFFPYQWNVRVKNDVISKKEINILSKIIKLKKKKEDFEVLISRWPFRYCATFHVIAQCLDSILSEKIARKRVELFDPSLRNKQTYDCIKHGPLFSYKNEQALLTDLVKVWSRCSVQMHNLCVANKIKYFHFLQPCQYLPNSKKMGEKELKVAFDENARHRQWVIKGYPYLIKEGKNLKSNGVNFYDLTMAFFEHDQPLYIDKFCHFEQTGSNILSSIIGQKIAKVFKENNKASKVK